MQWKAQIIGSGGINFIKNTETRISWDMLHPSFQGKGLGSVLLKHRISEIKKTNNQLPIIVRTSQMAFKFYEKNGFVLSEIVKDYWAKGFDLYKMVYGL